MRERRESVCVRNTHRMSFETRRLKRRNISYRVVRHVVFGQRDSFLSIHLSRSRSTFRRRRTAVFDRWFGQTLPVGLLLLKLLIPLRFVREEKRHQHLGEASRHLNDQWRDVDFYRRKMFRFRESRSNLPRCSFTGIPPTDSPSLQ